MQESGATLTLQDVADLAKVRRPVVSMWRKRRTVRGVDMPFPDPVGANDGIARFERAAVVAWLARTGRGNNAEHEFDAPAVAVPDGVTLEDLVTLLAWHVLTGGELAATTLAERVRLAQEADPDDRLLLREIRRLDASGAVLTYVDDLVEASFGAADALDRLAFGRLAREIGTRHLTSEAVGLLGAIVSACTDGPESVLLSVRYADDANLALALVHGFGGLAIEGDDAALRALRRRARIREIDVVTQRSGPAVSVRSLIGLDVDPVLDRLDDAVLELGQSDVVVALGPANVLCDALRGEADRRRAKTLRGGNLVAALRLPRGLWREAHRQALGVWVCAGRGGVEVPRVADLSAAGAGELDHGDLAADIAAAVQQTESRAFRYARGHKLSDILARRPVVPLGIRAIRLGGAETAHLDRVHTATLITGAVLAPLDVVAAPSPGRIRLLQRSLGEMRTQGTLVVKRGSRIHPGHASVGGTVGVLPVGPHPVWLDPLDVERLYPRAHRTEPGDIVIVEKPVPRAWVDPIGGNIVASPAKALRLRPGSGVGPHVLAEAINELAHPGTEWATWTVPILTDDESTRLEAALIAVERYEADVRARVRAVHELKQALIEGVAAGAVTLDVD